MAEPSKPVTVAILAFPETSASVVYGMYDIFMSAGRDWELVVNGRPGQQLMDPVVVSAQPGTLVISNDVRIMPHAALASSPPAQYVCVPEVNLPPGTSLAGRFEQEIAWLKQRYAQGATLAAACSGAMLLAEACLLDGQEATTHWAWCDVLRERYPKVLVREHAR